MGCDIPNAVWGLRVIGAHRRRTGGPGVTADTRCAGSIPRRIRCYSCSVRPFIAYMSLVNRMRPDTRSAASETDRSDRWAWRSAVSTGAWPDSLAIVNVDAVHGGDGRPSVAKIVRTEAGQARLDADAPPMERDVGDGPRGRAAREGPGAILAVARDAVDDRAGGARQPDGARPRLAVGQPDPRPPTPAAGDPFRTGVPLGTKVGKGFPLRTERREVTCRT